MKCKECLSGVAALMLVLMLIDLTCGSEVSPWVGYALPVILVSRYCGFSMGAAYAVIAAGLLLFAARYAGHPYSWDVFFLVAVAWKMFALLVIAWLTARLSNLERILRALSA